MPGKSGGQGMKRFRFVPVSLDPRIKKDNIVRGILLEFLKVL